MCLSSVFREAPESDGICVRATCCAAGQWVIYPTFCRRTAAPGRAPARRPCSACITHTRLLKLEPPAVWCSNKQPAAEKYCSIEGCFTFLLCWVVGKLFPGVVAASNGTSGLEDVSFRTNEHESTPFWSRSLLTFVVGMLITSSDDSGDLAVSFPGESDA